MPYDTALPAVMAFCDDSLATRRNANALGWERWPGCLEMLCRHQHYTPSPCRRPHDPSMRITSGSEVEFNAHGYACHVSSPHRTSARTNRLNLVSTINQADPYLSAGVSIVSIGIVHKSGIVGFDAVDHANKYACLYSVAADSRT